MGMLNRLIGQARRTATTPATTGRLRRPTGRGRTAAPVPAARGLGGMAQRLLGGRRRTI